MIRRRETTDKSKVFKIERITPDIILVKGPSQKRLAELLVRFQEHYESPMPEIRGKSFTLGQLKSAYAMQKKGAYTYVDNSLTDGDWSGFNFPSYVLEPFIRGLFDPLSEAEQDFIDMFRHRTDKFYVIGTHEDTSLDHEIRHALYYVNDEYKARVQIALVASDEVKSMVEAMKNLLRSWGYCEEVLLDEVHAYVGADHDWLQTDKAEDLVKFKIILSTDVRDELQKTKDEFFTPLDEKYKEAGK